MELSKALLALAGNCLSAVSNCIEQLPDRESVQRVAEGDVYLDLGTLQRIDSAIAGIPLHSLPDTLLTETMILGATVRQFIEKAEMALDHHQSMDSDDFEDLLGIFAEVKKSLSETCDSIKVGVERLKS